MEKKTEIDFWELRQRKEYASGVEALIEELSESAEARRDALFLSGKSTLRRKLLGMLGYPLTGESKRKNDRGPIPVRTEFLFAEERFTAERYQLEVIPGLWFYGILYMPRQGFKRNALIIAQHGGGGSPEIVGGLILNSANYHHMVERVLRGGVVVFAPQLLLWNPELYGDPAPDREKLNRRLIQLGGSMTALEVYCIMRCIDYFSAQSFIDKSKIGMLGLSYGGMYTIFIAALDRRIRAAYSSCWLNDRTIYNWPDWVYFNQTNLLCDAEVASLILPRDLFVEVGERDPVFLAANARRELERLRMLAKKMGCSEHLRVEIFSGEHELNPAGNMLDQFVNCVMGDRQAI